MNVAQKVYSLLEQGSALEVKRIFRKLFQFATSVSSLEVW
jgi:hypothetical protein